VSLKQMQSVLLKPIKIKKVSLGCNLQLDVDALKLV
jgi:hypothetical protein